MSATGEKARSSARAFADALQSAARLGARPGWTLSHWLEAGAETFGDRPALISEDERWSHGDLARRIRSYGHLGQDLDVKPGDAIALLCGARPDYLAAWLGLGRTGAVVSLLNTALPGPALAHCLAQSGARLFLVEAPFLAPARAALDLMQNPPRLLVLEDEVFPRLSAYPDQPLAEPATPRPLSDPALHIYTSGTTGLPKAAIISHRRVLDWAGWFSGLIGATAEDRIYDPLPLFHSVGGVTAPGSTLLAGGSVVLRRRFSASRFWNDVRAEGCTVFQYIGELCRFLEAAPPKPGEGRHSLRLIVGNGLRADVWERFAARFNIPQVLEFYAATEGSFSLYNLEGRVGSIGRFPPYLRRRPPAILVRRDEGTGEILRDDQGLAIPCAVDEPGEALGRLEGTLRFEGYVDAQASQQKILRDIETPGDAFFRTGDVMRRDAEGFFYFVDRAGDTFRWKGENVSTAEVEAVLLSAPGVREALVYGVTVQGAEGRAGMAALVTDKGFDLGALEAIVKASLAPYARPLYLRLTDAIATTDTFKPRRADYQRQGYDPAVVSDPLYGRASPDAAFAPLLQGTAP